MTKKILFWISLCVSFSCGLNAGFANNFDEISEQFRAKADNDQDLAKYIVNLETQIKRKRQGSALQGLLRLFYNAAPDGKLEIDKIPLLEAKDHAQLRSREIGRVLKWDLDGDGAISKTERESFAGSDAADIEFLFAIGDTDKNGTVNIVEITAFAAKNLRKSQRASKYTPLTLFDIDGDGIVLLQEIIKGLEALEKFPLDLRIKHVPQIKRSNEAKNRCKAPAPDAKSQLMILSGYEGRALSSVSIAGMDGVTHVAKVTIEPGKSPIYLFLSAYSNMIWQISGTTDRLQKVVVQKGRGGAGVVGVEKSKIHFIDAESCLGGVWDLKGGKGIIAINQAEKKSG